MPDRVRHPIHPGELLRQDVLNPLGLTADQLAEKLHVPTEQLAAILNEREPITPPIALRLAGFLGCNEQFWLKVQHRYDQDRRRQGAH